MAKNKKGYGARSQGWVQQTQRFEGVHLSSVRGVVPLEHGFATCCSSCGVCVFRRDDDPSAVLATDYSGEWTDDSTFVVTIIDPIDVIPSVAGRVPYSTRPSSAGGAGHHASCALPARCLLYTSPSPRD